MTALFPETLTRKKKDYTRADISVVLVLPEPPFSASGAEYARKLVALDLVPMYLRNTKMQRRTRSHYLMIPVIN